MKKVLIAGLIAVGSIGSAHAWGPHEQGILAGIAGLWTYQQLSQPRVVYQQQPQVIYQQTQTLPAPVYQPEVRVLPQYSPAYPGPNGCFPVYTQQGQFAGQMCR
jgi:hypothetical protein